MIRDITIDQTLIELARTMKALKALRAARKERAADRYQRLGRWSDTVERGCALRASMDLTRKLADLRQGR